MAYRIERNNLYRIERNNLYRYQGKRSDVAVCHDFHAAGDTDGSYYVDDSANKYYRIANISKICNTSQNYR